jgi:hypothetical protein
MDSLVSIRRLDWHLNSGFRRRLEVRKEGTLHRIADLSGSSELFVLCVVGKPTRAIYREGRSGTLRGALCLQ